MRACWLKWVGRDWSISADYIWLNYSDANTRGGIPYVYGISTWGSPLKDAPVDKLRISTRIKSIAVEAFGRHLKRVDASALFFVCM